MNEKEIVNKALKDKGYTMGMLAEDLGYKHASNLVSMLKRSKTMTVASFVRILEALGYEVVVKGKGKEYVVDSIPIEHGKYHWREVEEKVEDVEVEKIFEKEKIRMINGKRVEEISKGVWRYI